MTNNRHIVTIPPPPNNSLLIYTDGSKTLTGIGAGFAVYQTDSTHKSFQLIHPNYYKLPPYATVFLKVTLYDAKQVSLNIIFN